VTRRNTVVCPDCGFENPFYSATCSKCRIYLRDKVYNLDLWSISSLIIESPSLAFRKIILSEHKNFILFILFFISLKYLINARFVAMISLDNFKTTVELYFSLIIVLAVFAIYFLTFSILYVKVGKSSDIALRFKDTFSLIIYAQLPYLFATIILFPLELVIFGDYLFSTNPTPFAIKSTPAYLFLVLELSVIMWSLILIYKAFITQTEQRFFSMISSIIFFSVFFVLIFICSVFVFTI